MGLTREVGDTLLIRGYLSKDLKEVREQPQGDPGYGNGGWLCFRRRDWTAQGPRGGAGLQGEDTTRRPLCLEQGGESWGEAGRQAGREGTRRPLEGLQCGAHD